jgi:RNA polymerase sigma-70 factor (ECF subfamily)
MIRFGVALDPAHEAALLVRARGASSAQREKAFDELFEAFRGPVLALCLHLTGTRADAEDATQEVFLVVFKGLSRFRGESRLSTWIYRIAVRVAFRVKAKHPRGTTPLDLVPPVDTPDPALQRERSRQIALALERLSADHRTVLALFSLDGLSHREIAETLGIPEGTVWSRLHLARKKLTAELKALGFDMAT